jgi:uncharacterized membrane protein YtjA (UPF0391 family)
MSFMGLCGAKTVLQWPVFASARACGSIPATPHAERKERTMLNYALMFLLVGLIAGALGMFGVAAVATQIAWVLFLIGVVLLLIHLVSGRRTLTP